jgi:hypothetical protein
MSSRNLENLARIGSLKREPADPPETAALLHSGRTRLRDAKRNDLAFESRFDLGYNAAHAIALAALRSHGYRSDKRYIVFQCLEETLGLTPKQWTLLALCHKRRNIAEYEGEFEVDEPLLRGMLEVIGVMLEQAQLLEIDRG